MQQLFQRKMKNFLSSSVWYEFFVKIIHILHLGQTMNYHLDYLKNFSTKNQNQVKLKQNKKDFLPVEKSTILENYRKNFSVFFSHSAWLRRINYVIQ